VVAVEVVVEEVVEEMVLGNSVVEEHVEMEDVVEVLVVGERLVVKSQAWERLRKNQFYDLSELSEVLKQEEM
jgi:hypothetical protein